MFVAVPQVQISAQRPSAHHRTVDFQTKDLGAGRAAGLEPNRSRVAWGRFRIALNVDPEETITSQKFGLPVTLVAVDAVVHALREHLGAFHLDSLAVDLNPIDDEVLVDAVGGQTVVDKPDLDRLRRGGDEVAVLPPVGTDRNGLRDLTIPSEVNSFSARRTSVAERYEDSASCLRKNADSI